MENRWNPICRTGGSTEFSRHPLGLLRGLQQRVCRQSL